MKQTAEHIYSPLRLIPRPSAVSVVVRWELMKSRHRRFLRSTLLARVVPLMGLTRVNADGVRRCETNLVDAWNPHSWRLLRLTLLSLVAPLVL